MLDLLARFACWLQCKYLHWEDQCAGTRGHAMLTDDDIRRLPAAEKNGDGVWERVR